MKRSKFTIIVTLILLICFSSSSAWAANVRYGDLANDHWAAQSIYKMSAQNIIAGYEDNTVRPDNNITQFEAVCLAVRIMGLDSKTAQVAKGEYLPFTIPDWSGAYEAAVVAYEANLIDATDFSYNQSASREWIAKLLVKILGKEEQTKTTTEQLSFTDTAQIGSKYLNYVKVANSLGLIKGYTDGSFKPSTKVTRAEMAAFLTRVQMISGVKSDNVIAGEITALNGVSITISDGTNSKVVYAVDNSHMYNLTGSSIKAADLAIGNYVVAIYNGSLLSYLEIAEKGSANIVNPIATTTIEGKLTYIDANKSTIVITDSNDKLNTIVLTSATKVYKDTTGVAAVVNDLSLNAQVTAAVDNNQNAVSIIIKSGEGNVHSGSIHLVDVYKNIIIMDEDGSLVTYNMASDIKVSVSGMLTATTSSLQKGDMAQYSVNGTTMTAIAVSGGSSITVNGNGSGEVTIISVDTESKVINYLDAANNIGAKYYTNSTAFIFGSTGGRAEDLIKDDKVTLTFSGNVVSKVQVERSVNESTKGTIYSLDTTNRIIFIKTANGSLSNYTIAGDATIVLNDEKTTSLYSLKQDMEVALTVESNKVTKIVADSKIYGKISSIDKSNDKLTITASNGTSTTHSVATNVTVNKKNSNYSSLSALKVGDEVAFVKNSGNRITTIDVIVEVDYTVVKPNGTGSSLVKVTDKDGNSQTIGIDSSVELLVPGNNSPVAADLKAGDRLKVTYRGYNITKVEATATYSGTVSNINYTTGAVTLKGFDGNAHYFTFTATSSVTKGGYSYNVLNNNLSSNDRVAITQKGSGDLDIVVLSERTATVGVSAKDYIYLVNSSTAGDWTSYKIADNCYVHNSGSTTAINITSIAPNAIVTIYYADNQAYEVIKK